MISEPRLTQKELLAALPDSLVEMCTRIPIESVLELAARFGGGRLSVPSVARESSELTRTIGLASAQKLAAWCGGETIDVPRATAVVRAIRNKGICEGRHKGRSISTLARDFQLTRRQIMKILKEECFKRKQNDE